MEGTALLTLKSACDTQSPGNSPVGESTHGQGEVRCYWQLGSVAKHTLLSLLLQNTPHLCFSFSVSRSKYRPWSCGRRFTALAQIMLIWTHRHTHRHSTYMFGCVVVGTTLLGSKRAPGTQ